MNKQSINNYKKAGIDITILEDNKDIPIVRIKQQRLINGYLLNQKQLHERAKEVFAPQQVHVKPVVFTLKINQVTTDWILAKKKEYGIHNKDFIKQLALKESEVKQILKGEDKLNRASKTAFFYYFLVYELNTIFREELF